MHVELHPRYAKTEKGEAAKALASACVHCGFCLATCPTYLDNRDERDSPRGRIYLIKELLETGEAGSATRTHLDRCLTCRNCETTCPSGMEYGKFLDIGRDLVERETPRPVREKLLRNSVRALFSKPRLLKRLFPLGQFVQPLLPRILRDKIPREQTPGLVPDEQHARRMLILEGCVQASATPNTNAAAKRVLHQLGITLITAPKAGCCGALNYHLSEHEAGLNDMRRNIDAWWPYIEDGVQAIVSSASGCGAMLIDYGHILAGDPLYADKAAKVSDLSKDLGEIVGAEDLNVLQCKKPNRKVAIHTPCTLEHAIGQPDNVQAILQAAGAALTDKQPTTLCCGSAGTYSILQSAASERIRDVALAQLCKEDPDVIATSNVGCQLHLQAGVSCDVVHWIELLDEQCSKAAIV